MRFLFRPSLALSVVAAALFSAASSAWAQGANQGLLGEYYDKQDFTGTLRTRVDPTVNFNWVAPGTDVLPAGMASTNNFSVRWRGQVQALSTPPSGTYTFNIASDDGSKLYLDGQLIAFNWRDQAFGAGVTSVGITLAANTYHDITVEFYQGIGGAQVQLNWTPPGGSQGVIPAAQLSCGSVLATPTISPPGGVLSGSQLVTLSGPGGASLYYTLDGSDPIPAGPSSSATLYSAPFTVNTYTALNVRAYQGGQVASLPAKAWFSPSFASAVVANLPGGPPVQNIFFKFYPVASGLINLPNLDPLIPSQLGQVLRPTYAIPPLPARPQTTNFGYSFTGYIDIPADDTYTFYLNSVAGSKMWIGPNSANLVVNNDGLRSFPHEESGQITLQAGKHPVTIKGWQRDQLTSPLTNPVLGVSWSYTGQAEQTVPDVRWFMDPRVATPTFTPSVGANFSPTQTVTINCVTPGAIIYYTTNGNLPDPFSATGSGLSGMQITLTATTTLKAIAYVAGQNTSDVATITFTQTNVPPVLTAASAAGINTEVLAIFDKPVTSPTASTAANYSFTDGVNPPVVPTTATLLTRPGILMGNWRMDAISSGQTGDTVGASVGTPLGNNPGNINGTVLEDGTNVPFANYINPASSNPKSLNFDGNTGYVSVPHNVAIDPGYGGFTVSAWVRTANAALRQRVVNKVAGDDATSTGWLLDISTAAGGAAAAAGNVRFRMKDSTATPIDFDYSVAGGITANQWFHVVARVNKTRNELSLFVNGVQIGSTQSLNLNYLSVGNTQPMGIGTIPNAAGSFFNGSIDDVRLYSVALSNNEIAALTNFSDVISGTVKLTFASPLLSATPYRLTAANVQDTLGNAIPVAGSMAAFMYFSSGTLHREVWSGITGTTVADLARNANFPNNPSSGDTRTTLEGPNNSATNYGSRFRGFFIPAATGLYKFAIATDDGGKFFLSPDDDPANKVLLAYCTTAVAQRAYSTTGQSSQVNLTAGLKYYFEAFLKQGTGNDNIAVAASFNAASVIPDSILPLPNVNLGTAGAIATYSEGMRILTNPADRVVVSGQAVSFTSTASGTATGTFTAPQTTRYQWYRNGSAVTNGGTISGATTTTLSISSAALTDAGNYSLIASNGINSVTCAIAKLVVDDTTATPTISSLTKVQGPIAGGQTLTVSGSNFIQNQTTVTFGGAAAAVTWVNANTLNVVTPPHASGPVNVEVITPALSPGELLTGYAYYDPPTINVNGITPNGGKKTGGTSVTINGTNFVNGSTSVDFDGNTAVLANVTATSITLTTPPCASAQPIFTSTVTVNTPGGSTTIAFNYYDPPTINGVNPVIPNVGKTAGGDAIVINGTNFAPNLTSVTIDGLPATITGVTNTTINCTTPNHPAGGTVDVSVTTVDYAAPAVTAVGAFTYYPAPTFSAVNPITPAVGKSAGGDSISITGTNFSPGTTVNFGLSSGIVTSNNGSTITVTTPAGSGILDVIVTTAGGQTITAVGGFAYYGAPFVSGITPPSGKNAGGDSVTINGSNFSPGSSVTFGGLNGTVTNVTINSITVTTPSGSGTVPVVVSTAGNQTANSSFTYYGPPTILNINPTTGPSQGGTDVIITGTNFAPGQTTITFGASPGMITSNDGSTIHVTSPSHANGVVTVTVTTPGSQTATTSYTFNGPQVTGINPNAGPIGGGQFVTISGSGFSLPGTVSVSIGGNPATGVSVVNDTTITATTAAHAAASVSVAVTVGPDTATLANSYQYTNAATITNVSLNRGPVGGGNTITITGTNFAAGQTSVTIGGITIPSGSVSVTGTTSLTFTSLAHPAGAVDVSVSTFGSPPVTLTSGYTYVNPPTITSIVPNRGPIAGGQTVTISGTNFEANGQTTVSFAGGAPVAATAISATALTCISPAHAAGPVTVVVTTFGTQSTLPFSSYTYVDPTGTVDLALTMSASNTTPPLNSTITFIITASNSGAVTATGVVVQDLLPAGLSFVSAAPSVGSYNPVSGFWNLGVLNTPSSATLLLTVKVTTLLPVTNTAEVFACAQPDIDSTPNNGVPGEDDQASVTIISGLTIQTPGGVLAPATSGSPYYQVLAVSGGFPSYTWSLTTAPATFPFDLDPPTGVISGTAPAATGTYTFTVQVADSSGLTASQTYTIIVTAAVGGAAPTITTTPAPPTGTVGVAYTFQFTASGGPAPYTWSVSGGSLPAGLSLNAGTGQLDGTPTSPGTTSGLMIQASNGTPSTQGFTITINASPVTFVTPTLPNGSIGTIYDQPVQIAGGLGPTFNWSLSSGALPAGLTLTGTDRVGTITGTPSVTATFLFTLQATDTVGGAVGSKIYSITIPSGSPAFAATAPTTPPTGTIGQPFSLNLTGMGGTRPYTWSQAGGSLPTGLTFSGPAGTISGIPTVAGVFQLSLSVVDSAVPHASATQTVTINIAPSPLITTASPLPPATGGVPYFLPLSVTGGVAPYSWAVTLAAPPAGIALSPYSGALSGTSAAFGTAVFDVTVTDANGATGTKSSISLSVLDPAGALAIVSGLPPATIGVPYSATVVATGGKGPYTFALSPGAALPAGWSFDSATGTVFGTPPAIPVVLQIRVTDSLAASVDTNLLVVNSPLSVVQVTLPSGNAGSAYATALTASGGVGVARVWTMTSGSLPPGLSLSTAGMLSGVPQNNGSFTFGLEVSDTQGGIAQRVFTVSIGGAVPTGGGGGGGGGGCGLLGVEVLLLWLWRRERRRKA